MLEVQLALALKFIYQPENMAIFNIVSPDVLKGIIAGSAYTIMEEDQVNSLLAQFNRIVSMSQVFVD